MNRIATIRNRHGIKQKDLAAKLGWLQGRLSNYENARREPSLTDSRSILRALREFGAVYSLDEVFPPDEDESEKKGQAA